MLFVRMTFASERVFEDWEAFLREGWHYRGASNGGKRNGEVGRRLPLERGSPTFLSVVTGCYRGGMLRRLTNDVSLMRSFEIAYG
jgi:hypothetical protein